MYISIKEQRLIGCLLPLFQFIQEVCLTRCIYLKLLTFQANQRTTGIISNNTIIIIRQSKHLTCTFVQISPTFFFRQVRISFLHLLPFFLKFRKINTVHHLRTFLSDYSYFIQHISGQFIRIIQTDIVDTIRQSGQSFGLFGRICHILHRYYGQFMLTRFINIQIFQIISV